MKLINLLFILFIVITMLDDIANVWGVRKEFKHRKAKVICYIVCKIAYYTLIIVTYILLSPFICFLALFVYLFYQFYAMGLLENIINELEPMAIFRALTVPFIIIIIYLL